MTRKELRAKYNLTKDEYKNILKACSISDKQYLSKRETKLFEEFAEKALKKRPKRKVTLIDVKYTVHMQRLYKEVKAKYPHLNNKVIKDIIELNHSIVISYIKEGKSYRIPSFFTLQRPRKKAGDVIKSFGRECKLKRNITSIKISKKAREVNVWKKEI